MGNARRVPAEPVSRPKGSATDISHDAYLGRSDSRVCSQQNPNNQTGAQLPVTEAASQPRISMPFVSAYAFVTTFAYNFAYWGSFDINILQLASISDVATLAVWPLVGALVGLTLGVMIGFSGDVKARTPVLSKGGRFPRLRAIANRYRHFGLMWLLFVGNTILFFSHHIPARWVSLAAVVALTLTAVVVGNGFHDVMKYWFPPGWSHPTGAFMVILLPCISAGVGMMNAEQIRNGEEYTRVEITGAGIKPRSEELRLLGSTSRYTILLLNGGPDVWIASNDLLSSYTVRRVKIRRSTR